MSNTYSAIGQAGPDGSFKQKANSTPKMANTASAVSFDNTGTGMDATNVQDAVEELNQKIKLYTFTTGTLAYNATESFDLPADLDVDKIIMQGLYVISSENQWYRLSFASDYCNLDIRNDTRKLQVTNLENGNRIYKVNIIQVN